MPGQNFTSLGIDISSFTPEKENILNKFILLFEKLSAYDGKTINPVFGPGLVDFNTSVTATNTLLTELNTKLTSLTAALSGASGGSTRAAAANKALTAETAALKIQLQEANKALLDQAKANNASVQARENLKKSAADLKKVEKDLADQQRKDAAQDKKDKAQQTADARLLARVKREGAIASSEAARAEQVESRTTQKLISDYELLKLAQRDQATNYANLFIAAGGGAAGRENPAAKAALAELTATSTVIGNIETNLNKATKGAGNFGNSLTKGLSTLRTLAYILPGIGIAGIFNLAFEAIGNAAEALGVFNNKVLENLKRTKDVNSALLEQFGIYKDIEEQRQKLIQQQLGSSSQIGRETDVVTARGLDQGTVLNKKLVEASQAYAESSGKVKSIGGVEDAQKSVDQFIKDQKDIEDRIAVLQHIIDAKDERTFDQKINFWKPIAGRNKIVDGKFFKGNDEKRKADAEAEKASLELKKAYNEESIRVLEDNIKKENNLNKENAEVAKFTEDQIRKEKVETAKQNISLSISTNDKIISDVRKSEQVQLDALRKIRDEQKSANATDLFNVVGNEKLGIPKDLSATPTDISIAKNKRRVEDLKAEVDYQEKTRKLIEENFQIRLKDQSQIDQLEINTGAIRDEKIANNEQNSLQDRLEALSRYIKAKQEIEDIQYKTEIQQEKYRSKDPTVLKELERIDSERIEQKANIQADVEKKVYDIVYQSTQKELKLILDENKITIEKNREKYGQEVRDLTDSYRNKKISYEKYKKELKIIDDQYAAEALEKTIKQDEIAVEKIRSNLKQNALKLKESNDSVSSTQNKLIGEKEGSGATLQTQEDFDTALGKYEGYLKAVQNGELSLSEAVDKLNADKFARNNIRLKDDEKRTRQYYQAIRQVENALYQAIKQAGDQEYDYKRQQLELKKQLIDEQYGYEIAAIERSSLTAKDKAALDIQLQAQQHQHDIEIQKQEKRIAHDKAIFDRDLSIAHIILSTAEAVASLIAVPVLAVAAGIAGGAELAIASNVKIPSYGEGTGSHPGGMARYGEDGWEVVKEPYKSPYLVSQETIGYLPRGTRVIPLKDNPEFGGSVIKSDGWDQTRWLAKQFKKAIPQKESNIYVNINLGFESYKKRILGN